GQFFCYLRAALEVDNKTTAHARLNSHLHGRAMSIAVEYERLKLTANHSRKDSLSRYQDKGKSFAPTTSPSGGRSR
ncbi:MAG TPA: hypothetical protein VER32_00725, partial [Pyrinomonadaceae bacterium]|nr:hypothetical protein [Pyrinomonadaceae bacterium]